MSHYDCAGAGRAVRQRARFYPLVGKRLSDLALAAAMLPVLLPAIAVLWLAVRMTGAPGFYAHERIGRGGRAFRCLKIRTMVRDADRVLRDHLRADPAAAAEWESTRKLKHDPRVTGLGRWLRRSGLDELPQIWNVIRGDMSLVGPRPITRDELRFYGEYQDAYLRFRPGVTGIWQVHGRTSGCYRERVRMDRDYGREIGLGTDLTLIWRTSFCLFSLSGS